MSGCYSFFEAWTLAAEEIARAGRYEEAKARLDASATVRSLLAEWFGVLSEPVSRDTALYVLVAAGEGAILAGQAEPHRECSMAVSGDRVAWCREQGFRPSGGDFQGIGSTDPMGVLESAEAPRLRAPVIVSMSPARLSLGNGCIPAVPASVSPGEIMVTPARETVSQNPICAIELLISY